MNVGDITTGIAPKSKLNDLTYKISRQADNPGHLDVWIKDKTDKAAYVNVFTTNNDKNKDYDFTKFLASFHPTFNVHIATWYNKVEQ